MTYKRYFINLFLLPAWLLVCCTACKKYSSLPDTARPAYLRVYNNIPYSLDAFNKDLPQPFLTFLFDPKVDDQGIPYDANVIGDFLTTRQLYSVSYPLNAGNTFQKINYDYPGNAPVRTAPVINGFDLSAWAQMPSGRHRIMFVVRPFTDTAFVKLNTRERKTVLIDTTVDFTEGEVYTLEAAARDIDSAKYGLYLRQESFTHEHFDDDKLYLSVYNLTGAPLRNNPTTYAKQYFAVDTMNLFFTYMQYSDILSTPTSSTYIPMADYNNIYLTTLARRFTNTSPFYPLPFLARNYFYDATGQLRIFGTKTTGNQINAGTMPFISFNAVSKEGVLLKGRDNLFASIYSCGDPVWMNNYNQGFTSANGVDAAVTTANLNQFINIDGQLSIYPTVNIFEMVYDRVYHIQIQRYNNGH